MHKNFKIVDAKTKELIEEFHTLETAEKFLIMLKGRGKDVLMVTDDESIDENPGFEITGMEIEEPTVQFGNDLDAFNEDSPIVDNELPPVDNDDL